MTGTWTADGGVGAADVSGSDASGATTAVALASVFTLNTFS